MMRILSLIVPVIFMQMFSINMYGSDRLISKHDSFEMDSWFFGYSVKQCVVSGDVGSNFIRCLSLNYTQVLFLLLALGVGFCVHFSPMRRFLQLSLEQSGISEGMIQTLLRGASVFLGSLIGGSFSLLLLCFLVDFVFMDAMVTVHNVSVPLSMMSLVAMSRSCLSSHSLFRIDDTFGFSSCWKMFFRGICISNVFILSLLPMLISLISVLFTPPLYAVLFYLFFSVGLYTPFVLVTLFPSIWHIFAVFSPFVKLASSLTGWLLMCCVFVFYRIFALTFNDSFFTWNLSFLLFIEAGLLEACARWRNHSKIRFLVSFSLFSMLTVFLLNNYSPMSFKEVVASLGMSSELFYGAH